MAQERLDPVVVVGTAVEKEVAPNIPALNFLCERTHEMQRAHPLCGDRAGVSSVFQYRRFELIAQAGAVDPDDGEALGPPAPWRTAGTR